MNLRTPGLLESHAMHNDKKDSNYYHLYVNHAKGSMSGKRNKFKLKLRNTSPNQFLPGVLEGHF